MLIVVLAKGAMLEREEILAFLGGRMVQWWLPGDVIFIEELPFTATGEIRKTMLREIYRDYLVSNNEPE